MNLRKEILRTSYKALSMVTDHPATFRVVITAGDGTVLRYETKPGEYRLMPKNITERQEMILAAIEPGEILTMKEIAKRTGYTANNYLYDGLAEMVRLGLLERPDEGDGYRWPTEG